MFPNFISDFIGNAKWELLVVVMMTGVARIIKLTFGKKMTPKHEIAFWIVCICCGTIALEAANYGIIKPIRDQFQNRKIASPNLHCSLVHGFVVSAFETTPVSIFYQL